MGYLSFLLEKPFISLAPSKSSSYIGQGYIASLPLNFART